MKRLPSRSWIVLVLATGVVVATGCPVPASYTTATSAPVTGRISWDDGTPARDIPLVVATEWSKTPCEKAALRTMTDSAGLFHFDGLTEHHSVAWLVPNLDVAAPRFDVCATIADSLRHIYTGIGSLQATADSASVVCTILRWEGIAHASCNDRFRQNFVTGGQWVDSANSLRKGLYRILVTEEPTHVKGYDKGYKVDRPFVYVQWLEPDDSAGSTVQHFRVDTTVSLPIDRNKVTALGQVTLWRREGHWMTSLEGNKKSFMNDFSHGELIFALGAPGEARKVAGP
jgi:hypothetical protein